MAKDNSLQYYYWYKEHGICVKCKKEKAIKGETCCLVCKMDRREINRKYSLSMSDEQKQKRNQRSAERKQWCRDNHICVECYKRPTGDSKKTCEFCAAKRRERRRRERINAGILPREIKVDCDLCYFCGKPIVNGFKTCTSCRERNIENLSKVKNKNNPNHIWNKVIKTDVAIIEYNIRQK